MATQAGRDGTFLSQISHDLVAYKSYLNSTEEFPSKLRLLDSKNGVLLYWSELGKCIHSVSITPYDVKNDPGPGDKMLEKLLETNDSQTLICSISPLFDVTALKISNSGQHALIYGSHGIGIIELPRLWGDNGQYEGGKSVLHCRLTLLDESFFLHHVSTKVLEVCWYPGSPNDSHLVVLTNDNCLRFYDVTLPEQPMLRLPLFDHPHHSVTAGSISSFASVFGDLAVDFDIALPSYDEQGIATYPIYIMQESGEIWVLHCKFSQNRLQVDQHGPLTMNPPSEDNYGCNYCSLLCLETSPTTIAMATQAGTIHHCLVLDSESDDDGFGDLSGSYDDIQTEALYVYESVQLELNLLYQHRDDNDTSSDPLKLNNLKLIKDSTSNDCYVTICKGGVHHVTLPWLNDLNRVMLPDTNTNDYQSNVEIETPAEISYLLCTQPSDDSPSAAICGCTIVSINMSTAPVTMCLMLSGEFIFLNMGRSNKNKWNDNDNIKPDEYTYHSPLRKLRGVGSFDSHIGNILSKNATVPLIRCGGGDEQIPVDVYYKLLTKTTKILREEYIQKMIQAKVEYEKRCKILQNKKFEQLKEIASLHSSLQANEKGEEIASKLETAQERMLSITDRIANIFRNIQCSSPIISNDEIEWGKELKKVQEKLYKMKRSFETVKTKHENVILQEMPEPLTRRIVHSQQTPGSISTSQAIKVRAVLKEQESVISKLVEDVEALNIRLGS